MSDFSSRLLKFSARSASPKLVKVGRGGGGSWRGGPKVEGDELRSPGIVKRRGVVGQRSAPIGVTISASRRDAESLRVTLPPGGVSHLGV